MPEYDVELEVTYKTDLTLTVSLSGWTYGATANTPTVTGNTGNGAVTYNYKKKDADDETYSADVPTDAGTYTIRANVAETDDYADGVATADFTIAAADIATADITTPTANTLNFTGLAQTSTDGKTWTLASMPYYDVELEVEYYPAATLTTAPTSIGEVYATGSARRQHQAPTSYGIRWLATPRIATARLLPHA